MFQRPEKYDVKGTNIRDLSEQGTRWLIKVQKFATCPPLEAGGGVFRDQIQLSPEVKFGFHIV
ncbi:hypothetical protein SD074_07510 [Prolixibacter sp. SD074]|nr:hypothetical protein SD074_07510 [Prolixibacter sp. SD074]